jgi:hypothetical protein
MENAPLTFAGAPAAGSMEQAPFKAWTMGQPRSNSEAASQERMSVEAVVEDDRDHRPTPVHPIALRVKPDRRRVQLPIPAGLDRRRPR